MLERQCMIYSSMNRITIHDNRGQRGAYHDDVLLSSIDGGQGGPTNTRHGGHEGQDRGGQEGKDGEAQVEHGCGRLLWCLAVWLWDAGMVGLRKGVLG